MAWLTINATPTLTPDLMRGLTSAPPRQMPMVCMSCTYPGPWDWILVPALCIMSRLIAFYGRIPENVPAIHDLPLPLFVFLFTRCPHI